MSLIESIRRLDSIANIAATVGRELSDALHPQLIQLFLRQQQRNTFACIYTSGERPTDEIRDTGPFISMLRRQRDSLSGSFLLEHLDSRLDREFLERHAVELVVPLHGTRGVLLGFLLLGSRLSEQPYIAEDRKLLEALASQMAIVYENLSLQTQFQQQSRVAQELRVRLADSDPETLRECNICGLCFNGTDISCPVDKVLLVVTSLIPRRIAEHYLLERSIGKGGMGAVYEASDLILGRKVAIKVVPAGTLQPDTLRRLRREARILASLSHPSIVAIHDFGTADGGATYLVMEFVNGRTLRACMSDGSATGARIGRWFEQILDAIHAAHQAEIVHRDLKPENILIETTADGEGKVKVADFGLARLNGPETADGEVTQAGAVIGTIHYMAPEQLRGEKASHSADLFAIGVIAFEVLTGRLPFGPTYSDRLRSDEAVPIPAVTSEQFRLQEVLAKCMATRPEARFASALDLKQALVPLLSLY